MRTRKESFYKSKGRFKKKSGEQCWIQQRMGKFLLDLALQRVQTQGTAECGRFWGSVWVSSLYLKQVQSFRPGGNTWLLAEWALNLRAEVEHTSMYTSTHTYILQNYSNKGKLVLGGVEGSRGPWGWTDRCSRATSESQEAHHVRLLGGSEYRWKRG